MTTTTDNAEEIAVQFQTSDELAELRRLILGHPSNLIPLFGLDLGGPYESWLDTIHGSRDVLLLAPRGSGKSTVCCVLYSVWRVLCDPDIRILYLSDSTSVAKKRSAAIRSYLELPIVSKLFGRQAGSKWTDGEFTVHPRRGVFFEPTCQALGRESQIEGGHFDVIICDDLVTRTNTRSAHVRRDVRKFFHETLVYCRSDYTGELKIVGTRKHRFDLYNDLLARFPRFVADEEFDVRLEAKATRTEGDDDADFGAALARVFDGGEHRVCRVVRALSDRGRSVIPERLPVSFLLETKADDPHGFEREMQQAVRTSEHPDIPREWIRRWWIVEPGAGGELPVRRLAYHPTYQHGGEWRIARDRFIELAPAEDLRIIGAVDPAFTTKEASDRTAMVIVGYHAPTQAVIVLDAMLRKLTPTETVERIIGLHNRWRPSLWALASSPNLEEEIYRRKDGRGYHRDLADAVAFEGAVNVRRHAETGGDKRARFARHAGLFQSRKVHLGPLGDQGDLEDELVEFPDFDSDDGVDAITVALDNLLPERRREQELDLGLFLEQKAPKRPRSVKPPSQTVCLMPQSFRGR